MSSGIRDLIQNHSLDISPVSYEFFLRVALFQSRLGAQNLDHLHKLLPISDDLHLGLALPFTVPEGLGQVLSLAALQDVALSITPGEDVLAQVQDEAVPGAEVVPAQFPFRGMDVLLPLHLVEFPDGSWGGPWGGLVKC